MAKKEDVKKALKKGKSSFNLIGRVKITDKTFSLGNTYDSGWTDNQMYVGIDCGFGNIVYAEMKGGYFPDKDNALYGYDKNEKNDDGKSKQIEIDWEDRLDESLLDNISDSSFITVGVEKDVKKKTVYKKFLSAYDAVEYISEHLEDGVILNVKGNLKYNTYNDNVSINKEITSIVLSKVENEEDFKATFTQTLLLDSKSIGKKDNEKNTMSINAYVVDYVGKPKIDGEKVVIKKNVTYPKAFELAINEEKPDITSKMLTKFFKVVKKDDIFELTVDGNIIEGAAIIEISDDDIPDDIKELIEMGIYTEEEAKKACAVGNNNREKRLVITRPSITYVGDGEDRKPTVPLEKGKYKLSDLYFYEQALQDAGVDLESGGDNGNSEDDETDLSDEDLLAMLSE
ncbi:hypothetical protein [Anaerovorax sp. IOR16]|uniref:hypothetical protein n=1 Tax=Anaerovorax sp. IOR16 TaxID=2773458 RepID=UPI0019D1493B|nr:hypothetical protein [Anaerovorax sp. IOR16]